MGDDPTLFAHFGNLNVFSKYREIKVDLVSECHHALRGDSFDDTLCSCNDSVLLDLLVKPLALDLVLRQQGHLLAVFNCLESQLVESFAEF